MNPLAIIAKGMARTQESEDDPTNTEVNDKIILRKKEKSTAAAHIFLSMNIPVSATSKTPPKRNSSWNM